MVKKGKAFVLRHVYGLYSAVVFGIYCLEEFLRLGGSGGYLPIWSEEIVRGSPCWPVYDRLANY